MKKKHFAWIALLILISNLLVPFKQMYDVFADEKSTSNQTIINNTELSVDVVSSIDGEGIHWEINYDKQLKDARSSKLKFKLNQDNVAMQFPKTKNWQDDVEGNWFIEEQFTEKSKGKISFTTLDTIESLTFEIQMDEETESEDATSFVLSNVLDSKLQGPYSLKILELAKISNEENADSEEDKVNTDVNEEDTENDQVKEDFSDLETDEELNQKDIDETKSETDQDEVDEIKETDKEQGIVPIYPSFGRGIVSAQNEGARVYTDLFEYTEESIYPVHGTNNYLDSNSISEYVSNFNYGSNVTHAPMPDNTQGYTGVTNIGAELNFNTGYHEYISPENTGVGSSVLTKKTVKPTTDPNIFDIEVDVIGGATAVQTPIDIAFVVDRSSSMGTTVTGTGGKSRFDVLRDAVDAFADNLLDGSGNVRIGLASFQSVENTGWNLNPKRDPVAEISKFSNGTTGFTTSKSNLMNHRLLNPTLETAGTPTFLGVDAGLKLLTDPAYGARQDAKKVLIVLTDGEPTFWPNPNSQAGNYYGIEYTTKTSNINYDRFRMANNNYYGGNGTTSPSNAYTSTSGMVTQAYNNLGPGNDIEKYSIAFAFNGTNEVRNMLMNIGTFYDASNALTISTVLEAIRRDILDYNFAIDDGQLVDPLSDYVQIVDPENVTTSALVLNDETNQLSVIPSSDVDNYPGYAANIQGGLQENQSGFNFTNMNLGSANGIVRNGFRFNYQVQLKEDYRDGKFYPANGPTYANGRTYENSLGFAIPSIRSETIDIPVEKVWQGDQGFEDLRQNIIFELQQKRYGETNWTAVSGRTISIPKDAEGEALKGEFSKLPIVTITENNGTYSYHAIDYRIIEKVGSEQRVYGYAIPVISPDGVINKDTAIENRPVSITNTLLTTDLEFTKVNEAGDILSGAEFTLYRIVGEHETKIEEITDPDDSYFKFEGLPVGTYILKETVTPVGFETRDDITFTIEEETVEGQVSLKVVGFPDESTEEGIQIENKLNPFNLSILKQDTHTQKPLVGVKFSLTEKDEETVLAIATSDNQGIGIFQDSEGNKFVPEVGTTYIIKETQTIDGFVLSEMTFEVTVNGDGTVTLNESGEEYKTVELLESEEEENPATLIQITVNNTPKGLLPSTGGTGRQVFSIGSIAVLGVAGLIGGFYVYRNRKGAQ